MKIKKILGTITILFILLMGIHLSTVASHHTHDPSEDLSPIPLVTEIPIKITNINDGLGLNVEIKNTGQIPIEDITLRITTSNGVFIKTPKQDITIPPLKPGEITNTHIHIIGIGLGKIWDYPKVNLSLHAPLFKTRSMTISTGILGPFTNIVGEYYNYDESFQGYTLFTPEYSQDIYLINNNGNIVHAWKSDYIQGLGVYLLEDGTLLRHDLPGINPTFVGGGIGGRIEKFDWNGTLIWEFEYFNNQHCSHHDIEPLPNGNILLVAWEYKTTQEAIAMGRNPIRLRDGELWPDHVIEIKPRGTNEAVIVWEWHVWDHLIQDFDPQKPNYGTIHEHPELIDINYGNDNKDWTHINGIDFHEKFNQIILSVHNFNEIWVIDHSTTSQEAAGHTGGNSGKGGDILYRWGNPRAYGMGTQRDQKFFGQHDAQWVDWGCPGQGNILVFNNGAQRPTGRYSSVDEIIPPVNNQGIYIHVSGVPFLPKEQVWIYVADNPPDFFSGHISGTQRLPNGNTLICSGADGVFFEVTPDKDVVWKYVNLLPNPFDNHVFTIRRYSPDYPGLKNLFN
jgi:hypothetical protein